jgi:hypothetical protein
MQAEVAILLQGLASGTQNESVSDARVSSPTRS